VTEKEEIQKVKGVLGKSKMIAKGGKNQVNKVQEK
jgi:hypothetical protein